MKVTCILAEVVEILIKEPKKHVLIFALYT